MNLQRATALCVLLLTAANAWAQQQPETAAGAGTFTVTGDVDRPGSFSFEKQLTVRAAIAAAVPASDAVNVTVLRSGHDRAQSTLLLRLSSADSGEQAMSGDLYVVESLAQPTRPVLPNAVLRTSSGTTVISLEDAGVVVGDVLKGLGLPITSETRVSIPCRINGQRSLDSAPMSATVRHGDVITVTGAVAVSGDGTPAIKPMVSEWRGGGGSTAKPQFQTTRSVSSGNHQNSLPVIPSPNSPQIPATSASKSEPAVDTNPAFPATFSIPPQSPATRDSAAAVATPALPPADTPDPRTRNSESRSDNRVVIVGDRPQPEARKSQEEVLLLGDSLRVPTPSTPSGTATNSGPLPRDRANSKSGFTGRNVSGKHSKVPVAAAVSTRSRESNPDSTDTTEIPAPDTPTDPTTPVAQSQAQVQTLHWAVIIGLFVAGVWVLARSLFVGSISTSAASAAVTAPGTSEQEPAPEAAGNDAHWRIYSVPRALRPENHKNPKGASTDELDLLIANQVPVDRTAPQLPPSVELSGRSGGQPAGTIRRVDGPHTALRGTHPAQPDPTARRGRPLEERLSQLIRTVPTGTSGAER